MRLCSLPLLAFAAIPATAQPIATDRPDFTEGTSSVAAGHLQVEAGTTVAREPGGETVWSGPETLLRAGLGRGFEARLVLPDAAAPFTSRTRLGEAEFGDVAAGFKAELGQTAGVDAAVIAEVSVFGSAGPSPRALFIVGRDVGPAASVGAQAEAVFDREVERVLVGATLVGGLGLSERVGAFLEVAASALPEGPAAVVLHHGYTLALGEALQLDVHAGAGLTRTAPDVFVGAGVGVRF